MTGSPIDEWMLDWLGDVRGFPGRPGTRRGGRVAGQAVAEVPSGSVSHGWLTSRLADALYRTDDRAAAERVAERALIYANDADLIVDLQWTLAQCRIAAGSAEESFAALKQALNAPGINQKHRARLLVLAARTYLYFGDVDASVSRPMRRCRRLTEADDTWATGWAVHVLAAVAIIRGEWADALPLYDRGLAGDGDRSRAQ